MVFTLPEVSGQYAVGVTTFAVPIPAADDTTRVIGSAKFSSAPALKLEEVAFTAYYPADVERGLSPRKIPWLPEPLRGFLRGYVHFGEVGPLTKALILTLGRLARLFKFPGYPNAKLLDPQKRVDAPGEAWPLVLFSHGLGGTRTTYSHFCSRLASQGHIVIALEHKDGTGPFVSLRSSVPGESSSPSEPKLYIMPRDVKMNGIDSKDSLAFRAEQLLFRRVEIYLAYTYFTQLINGELDLTADRSSINRLHTVDGPWNFKLDHRQLDQSFWESWLPAEGKPRVRCGEDVILTGHSFGGATMMSLLLNPPPTFSDSTFLPLTVQRAIVLDPWVEPLPSPGVPLVEVEASLYEHPRTLPRLLVLNSEGYTVWTKHFQKLKGLLDVWNGRHSDTSETTTEDSRARVLTLVRAKHQSFSDFLMLFAFGKRAEEERRYLDITCDISLAFLQGNLKQELKKHSKANGETVVLAKPDGSEEIRLAGVAGQIIDHD